MRGIQIIYVSPSGATQEGDDLVKDLETWFEDHSQMCRLMTSTNPSDQREVASSFDKLRASVDSGQRILGRLKNSFASREENRPSLSQGNSRIPLSGMNRFDDSQRVSTQVAPSIPRSGKTGAPVSNITTNVAGNFVALTTSATSEAPRIMPSRTYLKKSGTGS
ncbi:MAG: hypothetical protein ACO3A4_08115 [Silvanigrellaceae bacterium]